MSRRGTLASEGLLMDARSAEYPTPDHAAEIMLLLDLRDPSQVAIERAMSLAAARGAKLRLIAVVRDGWRRRERRATLLAQFALSVDGIASGRVADVEVGRGSLRAVAIGAGRQRHPDLVVIGATVDDQRDAVAIAQALDTPVLVARARRPDGTIIGSSDLVDGDYPVLREASGLGQALGASVTYLHNAAPTSPVAIDPMYAPLAPIGVVPEDEAVASKQARLRTLADDAGADAVVVQAQVTSDAILEVARSRDADLVVIGHRRRSWLGRLFHGRLVDDIVARCLRSVLVLPIHG